MYYSASKALINNHPGDQNDLIAMDRAIARAYACSGRAWLDDGILTLRTGLSRSRVKNLAQRYVRKRILEAYTPVECAPPCGEVYEPTEEQCPACGLPISEATPSTTERYRVAGKPTTPLFDPVNAVGPFTAFISYRHGDTAQLASDLYFALTARGVRVFLDSGHIPLGVDFERVFLGAASEASYFLALVGPKYFDSHYCKREIAHALRSARNVVLIEVGSRLSSIIPGDMPWLARLNPSSIKGNTDGLSRELETLVVDQVTRKPVAPPVHDFQLDACSFLLSRLGSGQLTQVINRLRWLNRINTRADLDEQVQSVLREAQSDTTKVRELCAALRP